MAARKHALPLRAVVRFKSRDESKLASNAKRTRDAKAKAPSSQPEDGAQDIISQLSKMRIREEKKHPQAWMASFCFLSRIKSPLLALSCKLSSRRFDSFFLALGLFTSVSTSRSPAVLCIYCGWFSHFFSIFAFLLYRK